MPNTLVGMRADDLLEQIVHSYTDVTQVSSLVSKGNESKRLMIVQNDGNTDVYLMFGLPAVINQGLCIKGGGTMIMFTACSSSLASVNLYGITKSPQPVRILVTEGF